MIFCCFDTDKCVSTGDKFRIDVSQSYSTPDEGAFTLLEIEPEVGAGYIDVTSEQHLEWQYSVSGTKTVSVRLTTELGTVKVETIEVEAKDDECFLADDDCLKALEPEIYKYLPCQRCSYIFVHRKVVELIIDDLTCRGIYKEDKGSLSVKNPLGGCKIEKITCEQLQSSDQIKKWATYWALEIIFGGMTNSKDDLFYAKMEKYAGKRKAAGNSGVLMFDQDGDGEIEKHEGVSWNKKLWLA